MELSPFIWHSWGMSKSALALISGGVDSVSMLYLYSDQIAHGLSFDYGAKHNKREIPFAKFHCERLGIPHRVIELDFISKYFESTLLQKGGKVPHGHYQDDNMRSTVVPFRNGIMLSIATGMCESLGLQSVWLANHFGDRSVYPDCRHEFVSAMSQAIELGTYARISLVTPFTFMTKAQIVERGRKAGVDYELTWSCYEGGETPCCKCGTCLERAEALA